ncbi:MAG TPA: cysteine hydrolase family protein [Candidatus Nanoarchaeia archaeon]|nr:cysteine hydrolase family protein [Candidatus Nanoarchaeia archaeon]
MKTIFWNVDTQYDFMRTGEDGGYKGKLAVLGAQAIEPQLERLTSLAERKNLQVVNTADWHTKDSKELSATPDFKTTFPEHCMIGSYGAEFIPATQPRDPYILDWRDGELHPASVRRSRNIVLYKDHFDIFQGSPHAERVLELLKPERAVVYGVATNVCVNYAVQGLLERHIEVYVPVDAIKELPNLPLDPVLAAWQQKGAKLTTVGELEKMLEE